MSTDSATQDRVVVLHTRRTLLRDGSLVVLGLGVACTGKLPPATDDSSGTTEPGADDTEDTAPDPCDVEPEVGGAGWRPIVLADHPELASAGGSVVLDLDGHALIVAQPSEGCYVALSRICTHEGCTVEFRDGRFICPCHGAAFRIDGSVQAGPTPVPLPAFAAGEVDGVVWVQTG